jgi:hypothetical protein
VDGRSFQDRGSELRVIQYEIRSITFRLPPPVEVVRTS